MNGSIWAIGCWRNESDIARVNVLHHLAQGIDGLLIIDNGSFDGTFEILESLSHQHRVVCRRSPVPFCQDKILTELAREALGYGATWIIPIDADEFWHAPHASLQEVLGDSLVPALSAPIVNFVQQRSQRRRAPDGLLTMTKSAIARASGLEAERQVERGEIPFLEYEYPRKLIYRAGPDIAIGWGNHSGVTTGSVETCHSIEVWHVPIRSLECIERKALFDRPESEIAENLNVAWHVRHWRKQIQEGRLAEEWVRNSYDSDSCFQADDRLRHLIAPWFAQGTLTIENNSLKLAPPPVRLWGISVVRNESDILQATIEHHLSIGCERILIVDNGSTDETPAILESLSERDGRVRWTTDSGVFAQDQLVTALAREAFDEGATWILPFDADEWWDTTGERSLREILVTNCVALRVRVVNYLQHRSPRKRLPSPLEGLSVRPLRAVGPSSDAQALVEAGLPYILSQYPDKWISRASPFLRIGRGNHEIAGLEGEVTTTDEIVCRHAPLRSRAVLDQKRVHGRRLNEQGLAPYVGWHVRRWASMTDEELDREWELNTYDDDVEECTPTPSSLTRDAFSWTTQLERTSPSVSEGPRRSQMAFTSADETRVADAIAGIEGWLTREEAVALARAAVAADRSSSSSAPPLILEIGSYCGRSAVGFGTTLRVLGSDGIIISIDPHCGLVGAADSPFGLSVHASTARQFEDNLRRLDLQRWVMAINAPSHHVVWGSRIDLLFLDSLHDEETVAMDLERFEPWLAVGGTLAVHDYYGPFPGVRRAVDSLCQSGRFSAPAVTDSLALLTKLAGSKAL